MPNGWTDTATGKLKRWGFCDMAQEGNPSSETYRRDVPEGASICGKQKHYHVSQGADGAPWAVHTDGGSGSFGDENIHFIARKGKRKTKEQWFSGKNQDGTFAGLVREIIYTHTRRRLVSEEHRVYYDNGVLAIAVRYDYFKQGRNIVIEKVVLL